MLFLLIAIKYAQWENNLLFQYPEMFKWGKRLWCWEGLGARGEGDDRGWDGWKASRTRWTWVWVNSGSWWWTGRPGVLQFVGSQRVGHDWVTELNWKSQFLTCIYCILILKRYHNTLRLLFQYFLSCNGAYKKSLLQVWLSFLCWWLASSIWGFSYLVFVLVF